MLYLVLTVSILMTVNNSFLWLLVTDEVKALKTAAIHKCASPVWINVTPVVSFTASICDKLGVKDLSC